MRFTAVCVLLVAPLLTLATPKPDILTVDLQDHQLKDSAGRLRIYHATNVVYKAPPYHPQTTAFDPHLSFSQKDIEYLQAWGVSVRRLRFAALGRAEGKPVFEGK